MLVARSGEECGGFCGGKGECAKGLVCEKAMMKVRTSHYIPLIKPYLPALNVYAPFLYEYLN